MPTWRAKEMSDHQVAIVARAKAEAELKAGVSMSNAEFLVLMANDTSAKWRKA
jgi:hypothetical protein